MGDGVVKDKPKYYKPWVYMWMLHLSEFGGMNVRESRTDIEDVGGLIRNIWEEALSRHPHLCLMGDGVVKDKPKYYKPWVYMWMLHLSEFGGMNVRESRTDIEDVGR